MSFLGIGEEFGGKLLNKKIIEMERKKGIERNTLLYKNS